MNGFRMMPLFPIGNLELCHTPEKITISLTSLPGSVEMRGAADEKTSNIWCRLFGAGPRNRAGSSFAKNQASSASARLFTPTVAISQNRCRSGTVDEDPTNAGVRDEFRLNTFPPSGGSTPPAPAPPPAAPAK